MIYKEGYKYINQRDEWFLTNIYPPVDIIEPFYEHYTDGRVCLKFGYAWDGSSGLFIRDTPESQAPSALHDCICQSIQNKKLDSSWKVQGDVEYYEACIRNGMWVVRAEVRFFGLHFHDWENTQPKRVIEVPNVQRRS